MEAFCRENSIPLPSYKAYGKKVHAYWFGLGDKSGEVVAKLRDVGLKISDTYYEGDITSGISATNISYFKVWHWDE